MCDDGVSRGQIFLGQTPNLLFGAEPHHPGHETINPAPDDPYYLPVGGICVPRFNNLDGSSPADLCSGVGQILTIMALTASMQAHRPATLTLLKPQGTIQEVVAVVVARCGSVPLTHPG